MWESKGKKLKGFGQFDTTFENEIREHGDSDLEPNINKCKSRGIISKDEAKRLMELKNEYRNPFSHASIHKVLKRETAQIRRELFSGSSISIIEDVDISKMLEVRGEL